MTTIHDQRQLVQRLLDDGSIVDAPTAYYTLYHPPERSTLAVRTNRAGRPQGFAGRFMTGLDLFRPLVTMRARGPEMAADLLAELLLPGRPYIFFASADQLPLAGGSLHVENARPLRLYYLDSRRFRPVVNVLVTRRPTGDGRPRYEINAEGLQAVCGVNWQSPGFAEVYVHTEAQARRRGWGASVLAACSESLIRDGRLPLYLVDEDNAELIALAEAVGFVDSGGATPTPRSSTAATRSIKPRPRPAIRRPRRERRRRRPSPSGTWRRP